MRVSPVSYNNYKDIKPKANSVANNSFQSSNSPSFGNLVIPFNDFFVSLVKEFGSGLNKKVVDISNSACDIDIPSHLSKYSDSDIGLATFIKGKYNYKRISGTLLTNTDYFESSARSAQKGLFKNFKDEVFIGKFYIPVKEESGDVVQHMHMMVAARPIEEKAFANILKNNNVSHYYDDYVPGRGTINYGP